MIILPTMSRDNQIMLNTRINNKYKDFVFNNRIYILEIIDSNIRTLFNYAKILWEHLS